MSVWGALAGGFVGTLVLTTSLRAASELRLTRIDLPFLLGTAVTAALIYFAVFSALGRDGWLLGTLFGLAHGLFTGTALVNILLPVVHPRMGTPLSSIDSHAVLEPPGFLMLNYGRSTPFVSLAAHAAYGALVGGFTALAS